MREQEKETVLCLCCGARAGGAAAARVAGPGLVPAPRRAESFTRAAPPAPRRRCGLAYAAGYAGVTYLFGYSFAPFAQSALGQRGLAALATYGEPLPVTLWNLWAPVALVLAFAAGAALDRSRDSEGAAPALLGLLVGLWGTFVVVSDLLAAAVRLGVD